MNFWPHSATLSEDAATSSASGGGSKSNNSIFSSGAGMPAQNSGEIMISRVEGIALAAMDTEPDEAHGMRRARAESGLNDNQLKALKRRADHARTKGITLKGINYVRKPTATPAEEPSLLRKAAAKESEAVKEALREQACASAYSLPERSDHRFPAPHSEGREETADSVHDITQTTLPRRAKAPGAAAAEETNAASTMAALTSAHRRMRRRRTA